MNEPAFWLAEYKSVRTKYWLQLIHDIWEYNIASVYRHEVTSTKLFPQEDIHIKNVWTTLMKQKFLILFDYFSFHFELFKTKTWNFFKTKTEAEFFLTLLSLFWIPSENLKTLSICWHSDKIQKSSDHFQTKFRQLFMRQVSFTELDIFCCILLTMNTDLCCFRICWSKLVRNNTLVLSSMAILYSV